MRRMTFALVLVLAMPLPGATPDSHGALTGRAQAQLERAAALHKDGDNAGALDAYMEAVNADRNAADLHTIETYGSSFRQSNPKLVEEKKRAALRQYLKVRPADWDAAKKLLLIVDATEAESLIEPFTKSRPNDPDVYATRARMREQRHLYGAAAADYEKVVSLDPKNARHHLALAYADYAVVAKAPALSELEKRMRIEDGLAEVDRGEALEPGLPVAMMWRSLLLEEKAKLETDPEAKSKLRADSEVATASARERMQQRMPQKTSLVDGPPIAAPAGWQHVTSTWKSYEYALPSGWQKDTFNSYRGPSGALLEQINPPAQINPEYCRSYRSYASADIRLTEVENRVYDNGHVRGCFIVTDWLNSAKNTMMRHTSFHFITSRGVEDITLVEPMAGYSAERTRTIVDSVRTK